MSPGQTLYYVLLVFVGGGVAAVAVAIQAGSLPIPTDYAWLSALLAPVLAGLAHQITKRVPDKE